MDDIEKFLEEEAAKRAAQYDRDMADPILQARLAAKWEREQETVRRNEELAKAEKAEAIERGEWSAEEDDE